MLKQVSAYVTWKKMTCEEGNSQADTFEFLCADFIKEEYNLDYSLPIGKSNYPGTEGNYVVGHDGNYGFQAKFGGEPFSKNEIIGSIDKICDGTNILFICTKEEYPSGTRKKGIPFNSEEIKKNKDDWDDYTNLLVSEGKFIKVIFLCGNDFLNKVKKYPNLMYKFFPIKEILYEIYDDYEKIDVNEARVLENIGEVKNGFDGDHNLFKDDLGIAELHQRDYMVRKLGYANMSYVLDRYAQLEDDIADRSFIHLEAMRYSGIGEFLEKAIFQLRDLKYIQREYKVELESMISTEQGLFINYGTYKKSALLYKDGEKIKFINKLKG